MKDLTIISGPNEQQIIMKDITVISGPNRGEAELQPDKYPAKFEVNFSGLGDAFYGVDGGPKNQPLFPNQPASIVVNSGNLCIEWNVSGQIQIQCSNK